MENLSFEEQLCFHLKRILIFPFIRSTLVPQLLPETVDATIATWGYTEVVTHFCIVSHLWRNNRRMCRASDGLLFHTTSVDQIKSLGAQYCCPELEAVVTHASWSHANVPLFSTTMSVGKTARKPESVLRRTGIRMNGGIDM